MEIVVALTAVATLILSWILAALYYRDLPDTIVTHYNFSGLADGYGSKKMIFVMPGIATVIATGSTTWLLLRRPMLKASIGRGG